VTCVFWWLEGISTHRSGLAALLLGEQRDDFLVTMPLPTLSQPIIVTLADLSIASLASISATSPLVSTSPSACEAMKIS
jgi:hypothetical protein